MKFSDIFHNVKSTYLMEIDLSMLLWFVSVLPVLFWFLFLWLHGPQPPPHHILLLIISCGHWKCKLSLIYSKDRPFFFNSLIFFWGKTNVLTIATSSFPKKKTKNKKKRIYRPRCFLEVQNYLEFQREFNRTYCWKRRGSFVTLSCVNVSSGAEPCGLLALPIWWSQLAALNDRAVTHVQHLHCGYWNRHRTGKKTPQKYLEVNIIFPPAWFGP